MAAEHDERIDDFLREHAVETVILCGTDLIGKQRGKRVSPRYLREAARKGIRLASFIHRAALLDEPMDGILETGIPDVVGLPDMASLRLAGWERSAAIVMLDWKAADGADHPLCARTLLRRQVEALATRGLSARAAFEFEFFLVPRDATRPGLALGAHDPQGMPRDVHCYGVLEGARDEVVLSRLRAALPDVVEGVLPEWGHGQREANLWPQDPLRAADDAVHLKLAARTIAAQEGFTATFMAKWRADRSGSSAHLHLSLQDPQEAPAFWDAARPDRLSETADHWLGGQVALFRETALFHAPFVNSYRRFRPGSFAPINASAGIDNRTVAFRVLNHAPEATRIEHRVGGADLNPYASLAAILAVGRHGLANALPRPPFAIGNAYAADLPRLPASVEEAAALAHASVDLARVLPVTFTAPMSDLLVHEAALVAAPVPSSEIDRYFIWA